MSKTCVYFSSYLHHCGHFVRSISRVATSLFRSGSLFVRALLQHNTCCTATSSSNCWQVLFQLKKKQGRNLNPKRNRFDLLKYFEIIWKRFRLMEKCPSRTQNHFNEWMACCCCKWWMAEFGSVLCSNPEYSWNASENYGLQIGCVLNSWRVLCALFWATEIQATFRISDKHANKWISTRFLESLVKACWLFCSYCFW